MRAVTGSIRDEIPELSAWPSSRRQTVEIESNSIPFLYGLARNAAAHFADSFKWQPTLDDDAAFLAAPASPSNREHQVAHHWLFTLLRFETLTNQLLRTCS